MEQELKKINIHKDYVLFQLMVLLKEQLGVVCSYMQKVTPYSKEYDAAYAKYLSLRFELDKFESLLEECLELAEKEKE